MLLKIGIISYSFVISVLLKGASLLQPVCHRLYVKRKKWKNLQGSKKKTEQKEQDGWKKEPAVGAQWEDRGALSEKEWRQLQVMGQNNKMKLTFDPWSFAFKVTEVKANSEPGHAREVSMSTNCWEPLWTWIQIRTYCTVTVNVQDIFKPYNNNRWITGLTLNQVKG